jgi:hypothetical protein
MSGILSEIYSRLSTQVAQRAPSQKVAYLELFVNSCNTDMYDYININRPDETLLTERPLFTNIDNGIGLFAARREGIKVTFTKYSSSNEFWLGLGNLNVGF